MNCELFYLFKCSFILCLLCYKSKVLGKTLESPLDCKEIHPVHPQGDQSWVFIGRTDVEAETPNTLATWCEESTHWKRPWCWERLKVGGEGMTEDEMVGGITDSMDMSLGKLCELVMTRSPGMLQSMGWQRVRHNWAIELNCYKSWQFMEWLKRAGKDWVLAIESFV